MTQRIDRHVDHLLDQAHCMGSCLAVPWQQREAIGRRIEQGSITSPATGLYARSSYWERLDTREQAVHIMRGHLAKHPSWLFCMFSAAAAYDLDVPFELLETTHIARPMESPGQSTNEVIHHGVKNPFPSQARGIPVTGIEETVLECLCDTSFELGLAIVDSALHRGLATKASLERYFRLFGRGRRGIRQARQTLLWADGRSENGGESRVRAIMIEEGFAIPELQVEIPDPLHPGRVFRVDYLWRRRDGICIAGELDGKAKYLDTAMLDGMSTVDAFSRERQREALLTANDLRVVRFSFAQAQNRDYLTQLLQAYGVPMR